MRFVGVARFVWEERAGWKGVTNICSWVLRECMVLNAEMDCERAVGRCRGADGSMYPAMLLRTSRDRKGSLNVRNSPSGYVEMLRSTRNGPVVGAIAKPVVGDEGLRRFAQQTAFRCGARAPCVLRWETATPFPQLRTLAGSSPVHGALNKKRPRRRGRRKTSGGR